MRANTAVITKGITTRSVNVMTKTQIIVLTIQEICRIYVKAHRDKTHTYFWLSVLLCPNQCTNNSCAHVTLTLNDVGHHEGGAGVVADQMATSQVMFDLQGK